MNRMEFLQILESKLSDISDSERKEALQYYNDYFDDAGVENEQEVMEALGSPEKVAASIKSDLNGRETGEFTERGYKAQGEEDRQQVGIRRETGDGREQDMDRGRDSRGGTRENPFLKIVLIILICLVLSPIILPVGGVVLGAVLAVLGILFGAFVGVGVSGLALLIVGFIGFVIGLVKVFMNPLAGAVILGISFLLLGIGILLTLLTVWICITLVPVFIRGIVKLIRRPFEKRGGLKA